MDHKTLGDIFQEICSDFTDMKPTNLDELEDRVLNAMQKLGSYLMEKKIEDWNIQIYQKKQETCEKCGSKLKHKQEERQIATWVSDVIIKRYKRYCRECKETEYPLDQVLGLHPRQRYSNSVEELTVLCGASWDYGKSEYIMKKVLRRPCVSHETIFNKTNEVGESASKELEGTKIKELEEDKRAQGDYFDNMEVIDQPVVPVYMDMDGVMINSRDNEKRMEGKVAVVWSRRELVKSDTYALTDKRYMGSFTDPERFYWDVTAELYKRSGGKMDDILSIVRGDGAPFIRGFRSAYAPMSRYLLDHHHLCEKLKERLGSLYEDKERREEAINQTLGYLNSDDVDGAISYIQKLID